MIKADVQWLQRNDLTRLDYDARYKMVLFSYLSGKMKVKKGVSQLDQGSGVFTLSVKEVAEVLNEYFTSVYTHEPTQQEVYLILNI